MGVCGGLVYDDDEFQVLKEISCPFQEEEEWKEYEEPVKDYTGLKIQVLQGGNSAQEAGRDPALEDSAPDGSGKGKGPWNKPVSFCF